MLFSLLEFAIGRNNSNGKVVGYFDLLSIELENDWYSLFYIGKIEGDLRFDLFYLRVLFRLLDK